MATLNFNLTGASDINVSGFNRTQSVTLTFYQPYSAYKYYRLKLNSGGVYMYIYLGAYATNPKYVYTHTFNFNDETQVFNGSLTGSSFAAFFTQYFKDSYAPRFEVDLQASTVQSFSSNIITSSGSRTLSIRLAENSNFIPSWSIPEHTDTRASYAGIALLTDNNSKKGVQGKSVLKFTFTAATPKFGASNVTYRLSTDTGYSRAFSAADIQANPDVYLFLENHTKLSGNVVFTFSVEDSRGFKRTFTKTITIVPYSHIKLTENNTHRINGINTKVVIDFKGQWHGSPLTLSCKSITAYEQGSSAPIATVTPEITVSGNTFSCYVSEWSGVTFDKDKAYTITAVFSDQVEDTALTLPIPVGTPVIAVRDKKVGINNSDPQSALDVLGTIIQNGFPVLGYKGEIGTAESCNLNNYTEGGYYFYAGNSAEIAAFPSGYTKATKFFLLVIDMGDYKIQKTFNIAGTINEHKRAYTNGFLAWN